MAIEPSREVPDPQLLSNLHRGTWKFEKSASMTIYHIIIRIGLLTRSTKIYLRPKAVFAFPEKRSFYVMALLKHGGDIFPNIRWKWNPISQKSEHILEFCFLFERNILSISSKAFLSEQVYLLGTHQESVSKNNLWLGAQTWKVYLSDLFGKKMKTHVLYIWNITYDCTLENQHWKINIYARLTVPCTLQIRLTVKLKL